MPGDPSGRADRGVRAGTAHAVHRAVAVIPARQRAVLRTASTDEHAHRLVGARFTSAPSGLAGRCTTLGLAPSGDEADDACSVCPPLRSRHRVACEVVHYCNGAALCPPAASPVRSEPAALRGPPRVCAPLLWVPAAAVLCGIGGCGC